MDNFIYGAETVGKVLLGIVPNKIKAFVDYNPAKKEFCGLPVLSPKNLPLGNYLISVMSIRDVVNTLEAQGIGGWVPGGTFLKDIDTTQFDYQIDDEKYQIESVRIVHDAFMKNKVFLRSLDIMITERCSLKCKDCSNLMQYFEHPKDYGVGEVINSFDSLIDHVDEIMEARVLGGDAFMHFNWWSIVDYLIHSKKVRRVMVYTNGVIVPWDIGILSSEKVIVVITDYGKLSRNLAKIINLFEKNKVRYKIVKVTDWIDCASIQKHNRTTDENDKLFQNCVATNLITLVDGKVFRCPFAASAFKLGVTVDAPSDYLNVTTASKKALNDYIQSKKAMSICDYCTSRILSNKIEPAIQTKIVRRIE